MCLYKVLPAWRGGEGGKGTSGVSWGWGYTWEVALKGVVSVPACLSCVLSRAKSSIPNWHIPVPSFLYIRTAEQPCTKLHDAILFKLTIKHLKGTVCKDVYIKKRKRKKRKKFFF